MMSQKDLSSEYPSEVQQISETIGVKPIRKCTKCGYEVTYEVELGLFVKDKGSKYGRRNLCKDCSNLKNREDIKSTEYKHKHQLAKRYNCTPEEYEERMKTSNNCEVCGTTDDLCYDHDHNTMEFRGVLCRKCNAAIGQLGDDVDGVRNALCYLVKHYAAETH